MVSHDEKKKKLKKKDKKYSRPKINGKDNTKCTHGHFVEKSEVKKQTYVH